MVESDLFRLLDEGHLSGAALDVVSEEPLPTSHPFWQHPKIILTPHIASCTNIETTIEQIADNYRRLQNGEELANVVSTEKGY